MPALSPEQDHGKKNRQGKKTEMIWQIDLFVLTLIVICGFATIMVKDLLSFARETDSDLIVMGNSVHTALLRRLLGDTVLETIKNADRPLFLSQ